jgi:hypothetical protein
MAKPRSSREVRPASTSGWPRCSEPSSRGPSRLNPGCLKWSVVVGLVPCAWPLQSPNAKLLSFLDLGTRLPKKLQGVCTGN